MVIFMSFGTFGIICLILFLVFGVGAAFMKTSKKQYREWWALQRPNEPLPEKYKFDPNDPDDDKPKMGTSGKIIIGILIFIATIFVLIIVAVIFDLGKYLEDDNVLKDTERKIHYNYQVSDINEKTIDVSFTIKYVWSPEKEEQYENNIQLEDYIKSFFKNKDLNYAYDDKGYFKDIIKKEWGEPILQYMRELFSDESIKYYVGYYYSDRFYVKEN